MDIIYKQGWLWGLLTALILSFHEATGKYLTQYLSPLEITCFVALAVGVIILALRRAVPVMEKRAQLSKGWWVRLLVGTVFSSGGFLLYYYGLQRGTVTETVLISQLEAAFTALFGFLFFREKLSSVQSAGLALALMGAAVFTTNLSFQFTKASIALLAAAAAWGFTNLIYKSLTHEADAMLLTGMRYLLGGVIIAPLLIGREIHLAGAAWGWLLLNALVLGLGMVCLFEAMRNYKNTAAATIWYLPAAIGSSVVGAIFFGDRLSLLQVFAACTIIIGVVLVIQYDNQSAPYLPK